MNNKLFERLELLIKPYPTCLLFILITSNVSGKTGLAKKFGFFVYFFQKTLDKPIEK